MRKLSICEDKLNRSSNGGYHQHVDTRKQVRTTIKNAQTIRRLDAEFLFTRFDVLIRVERKTARSCATSDLRDNLLVTFSFGVFSQH